MGETAHIAEMASKLSNEIFSEFLWERTGPTDQNWPCEEKAHNRKTHPSDVVFFYDNPYSLSRTYVNCDLKSYSSGTIKAGAIGAAIESLAQAVNCAEKSKEWQKLYLHEHVAPEICGLLFVYNHDGQYDKEFHHLLLDADPDVTALPKKSKIIVMGPDDIFWLSNVSYEINSMRGKQLVPSRDACKYFYPHLVRRKKVQIDRARAANLEMLTGPWIILSYPLPGLKPGEGFVVFYRSKGDTVQEFLYLIDYLLHYQVMVSQNHVRIKTLGADPRAKAQFQKAVDEYVDQCENGDEMKNLLNRIEFSSITQVQTQFSEVEIGMDDA